MGEKEMKKIAVTIVAAAMVLPVMTGCAVTMPDASESEETVAELGPASPNEDYFRFVNEDALKNAEFEYGSSVAGSAFNQKMINDQIEGIIDDVVAGSGYAEGTEEYIIKRAYELYLSYDFENEEIPSDLQSLCDEIDNASSVEERLMIDARLSKDYGIGGLIIAGPQTDPFNSERKVMTFPQINGFLNTPFTNMRDDVFAIDYIKNDAAVIMSTRGYDKETSEQYGTELATIAIDVYSKTNFDVTDDTLGFTFNKIYTKDQVKDIFSNVDIDAYFTAAGYDVSRINDFCLSDEAQLRAYNSWLTDENLNALKASELGDLYSAFSRYIAK